MPTGDCCGFIRRGMSVGGGRVPALFCVSSVSGGQSFCFRLSCLFLSAGPGSDGLVLIAVGSTLIAVEGGVGSVVRASELGCLLAGFSSGLVATMAVPFDVSFWAIFRRLGMALLCCLSLLCLWRW